MVRRSADHHRATQIPWGPFISSKSFLSGSCFSWAHTSLSGLSLLPMKYHPKPSSAPDYHTSNSCFWLPATISKHRSSPESKQIVGLNVDRIICCTWTAGHILPLQQLIKVNQNKFSFSSQSHLKTHNDWLHYCGDVPSIFSKNQWTIGFISPHTNIHRPKVTYSSLNSIAVCSVNLKTPYALFIWWRTF